jgi:hypothetical protein
MKPALIAGIFVVQSCCPGAIASQFCSRPIQLFRRTDAFKVRIVAQEGGMPIQGAADCFPGDHRWLLRHGIALSSGVAVVPEMPFRNPPSRALALRSGEGFGNLFMLLRLFQSGHNY